MFTTVVFLERKVEDFISPTQWPPNSPDLNPVDYSIWNVLQGKGKFTIQNSLRQRTWNAADRWVAMLWPVDRGCWYMYIGQWRRRLSACFRGAGHTFASSITFQLFCYLLSKVI